MAAKIRRRGRRAEALVELLFDEIEEMNLLLAERDASLERIGAVAARQHEMLARALSLAEAPMEAAAPLDAERLARLNDRSAQLIETALEKLAARDGDIAKLTSLLDRALTTIEGLEAEVKRQGAVARTAKGPAGPAFRSRQYESRAFRQIGGAPAQPFRSFARPPRRKSRRPRLTDPRRLCIL